MTPPESQTVVCVRCAARGQLEPWGERGMLPYGWHFEVDSNEVRCPSCWLAGFTGMIETAERYLREEQRPGNSAMV